MKKSNIIAAIIAFAPAVFLSSCDNNGYEVISDAEKTVTSVTAETDVTQSTVTETDSVQTVSVTSAVSTELTTVSFEAAVTDSARTAVKTEKQTEKQQEKQTEKPAAAENTPLPETGTPAAGITKPVETEQKPSAPVQDGSNPDIKLNEEGELVLPEVFF